MYSSIAANKRKTVFIFLVFIVLISGLGWLVGMYLDSPFITPYVLIGGLIYGLIVYYSGTKMSLAVNGAKQIEKRDDPRLWRIVENLAITEGLPMPKVYIMEDPALNAFATGRNPQNAAVCATRGLLDALDDKELEGVMAHELGHVKNFDIRVSMIAFALVAIVGVITDIIWWMSWGRDREGSQLTAILGIAAIVLAPIVATMIQLAISRKREYLADATGALATRYPEGLASALEKIQQQGSATARANSSTAHLFFANPLKSGSFSGLFSTHPPIEDRVRILREMGDHE
jgi:heat shock protein HtpX